MDIKEMLPSPKEQRDACTKFQEEHWLECDEYDSCQDCPVMAKNAQLKLLKVLEEPCNYPLHIAYVGKHDAKWSCPLCMQELKNDLGEIK